MMVVNTLPSVNVLGTRIAAVNPRTALAAVRDGLAEEAPCRYVCLTGVHGVMEGRRDPTVRAALNGAAACFPDGMPMVWRGRLAGFRDMARVYGPDLMLRVMALCADTGRACYFYGGAEGVAALLAAAMRRSFPALKVAGLGCPPFRPLTDAELDAVAGAINATGAAVVWIGISTPKQDLLMARLAPRLTARFMFGVGAAFDFHTGRLRQAPRWMMRSGLEWAFRLALEPRRLWKRYLYNNPSFIMHTLLQMTGCRTYPIEP